MTVLAATIVAVALGAMPSLAGAQDLSDIAIVTGSSSGNLVLDVNAASTAPGAPVIQWYANGGANQRWDLHSLKDGTELIINRNSGMCLTTDGVVGHWVYQWPCAWNDVWSGTTSATLRHQEWTTSLSPSLPWNRPDGPIWNPAVGLALNVPGDSPWPGAHLSTWFGNNTSGGMFAYYQLY